MPQLQVKNSEYIQIGHTSQDLSPERTLSSLYLKPLIGLIRAANMHRQPAAQKQYVSDFLFTVHFLNVGSGIFETAPLMPLNLLIDIKTDGPL